MQQRSGAIESIEKTVRLAVEPAHEPNATRVARLDARSLPVAVLTSGTATGRERIAGIVAE